MSQDENRMADDYYPPGADPLELDALDAAAAAHLAEFNDFAAVRSAEHTVSMARAAEVTAAYESAKRRIPAAKGRLTRARNTGDAQAIAAAEAHLAAMEDTAGQALRTAMDETGRIHKASLDRMGVTNDLLHTAHRAMDTAYEARFPKARP